jgi:hypothetical protein
MREYGQTHETQQPQVHFSPLPSHCFRELLVWSVGTVARAMRVLEQSRSEAQATLAPRSAVSHPHGLRRPWADRSPSHALGYFDDVP